MPGRHLGISNLSHLISSSPFFPQNLPIWRRPVDLLGKRDFWDFWGGGRGEWPYSPRFRMETRGQSARSGIMRALANRLMLADAPRCYWLAWLPPICSALTTGDSRRCQWSAGGAGPLKTRWLVRGCWGDMGSLGRWGAGLSPGTGRTDSPKTAAVGMRWGAAPVFSPANGPCRPVGRALERGSHLARSVCQGWGREMTSRLSQDPQPHLSSSILHSDIPSPALSLPLIFSSFLSPTSRRLLTHPPSSTRRVFPSWWRPKLVSPIAPACSRSQARHGCVAIATSPDAGGRDPAA